MLIVVDEQSSQSVHWTERIFVVLHGLWIFNLCQRGLELKTILDFSDTHELLGNIGASFAEFYFGIPDGRLKSGTA